MAYKESQTPKEEGGEYYKENKPAYKLDMQHVAQTN